MEKMLKEFELRGDQQKKMEYQQALNALRDLNQPIESLDDLNEEDIPNLSDEMKDKLKNAFKEKEENEHKETHKQEGFIR